MDIPASPNPPLSAVKADCPAFLHDDKIKPMILVLEQKTKHTQLALISNSSDQALQSGAQINALSDESNQGDIIDQSYNPTEAEELLPQVSELDNRSPSPDSENAVIKHLIRESAYQKEPLDDRPTSPTAGDESKKEEEMISKPAHQAQTPTEQDSWPSIPIPDRQSSAVHRRARAIRQSASDPNLRATQVMLYGLSLSSTNSPDHHNMLRPNGLLLTDLGYQSPAHDYRNSPKPRLSSVPEESESFSRREFGDNVLTYMSTFSSANHAANAFSNQGFDFRFKHCSYRHNNYHNFTYDLSSSYEPHRSGGMKSSKSAPAGTTTRSGSAFGLFRRASSETSALKLGRRTVYRPRGTRKPRTLASTILWPLVKIKNGYVGCMMGLEDTGDLTGMAQGGSYATVARYFDNASLSKIDLRNFG